MCHSYCKTRCLPSCKFTCCEKQNTTEEVNENSILFEEGFDLSRLLKSLQETQNEYRKFKTYIVKLHNATGSHKSKSKKRGHNKSISVSSKQKEKLNELEKINEHEQSNEKIRNNEKFVNTNIISQKEDKPLNTYSTNNKSGDSNTLKNGENITENNAEELKDQHSEKYLLPMDPRGNPRSESTTKHLAPHGNFIYNPFFVSERLKDSHILAQMFQKNSHKDKKMKSIKKIITGKKSVKKHKNAVSKQSREFLDDSKITAKIKALNNKRKFTKALKEIENLQTTIKENIEYDEKKLHPHIIQSQAPNANVKIEIYDSHADIDEKFPSGQSGPIVETEKFEASDSNEPHNVKELSPAPSMFQEFQEATTSKFDAKHLNIQSSLDKGKKKAKSKKKVQAKVLKSNNWQPTHKFNTRLAHSTNPHNDNSWYSELYKPQINKNSFDSHSSDSVLSNSAQEQTFVFPQNSLNYPINTQYPTIGNFEAYSQPNQCVPSCGQFCSPYCERNCCENSKYEKSTKQSLPQPTPVLQIPAPTRDRNYAYTPSSPTTYGENAIIQTLSQDRNSNTKATKLSEATLSATRRRIQDLISLLQETSQSIQTNTATNTNVCHIGCKKHCLPSCHFECC